MQDITISLLLDRYFWFPMVCFFVGGVFMGFAIASIIHLIKDKQGINDVGEKNSKEK